MTEPSWALRNGVEQAAQVGVLAGIARHAWRRAPIEVIDRAAVTLAGGIAGDYRGALKGQPYKRQVTLLERGDWELATAAVGVAIAWEQRRSNLLVDGLDLPQTPGARLRIGADVVLEITDPCERMEDVAPGLMAALRVDWRGGACTRVVAEGVIAIGDLIRIEEA